MKTLLCSISTLVLFSCGAVGNGSLVTVTPTVAAFKRVSIGAGATAEVTLGAPSVTIRIDENLAPLVETVVEGETLRIGQNAPFFNPSAFEVTVSNEVLEGLAATGGATVEASASPVEVFEVSASGGSRVTLTGISSRSLRVSGSGGSDLTVSGTATTGDVELSGGSKARLRGISLDTLVVDLSGGSTLEARVASRVSGDASAGSTVTITGMPTNEVSTSGGSTVTLGAP